MTQSKPKNCPVCGKPSQDEAHPFCSSRCAQIDLGRWLGEKYVIQMDDAPSSDEQDV